MCTTLKDRVFISRNKVCFKNILYFCINIMRNSLPSWKGLRDLFLCTYHTRKVCTEAEPCTKRKKYEQSTKKLILSTYKCCLWYFVFFCTYLGFSYVPVHKKVPVFYRRNLAPLIDNLLSIIAPVEMNSSEEKQQIKFNFMSIPNVFVREVPGNNYSISLFKKRFRR